MRFPFRFPAAFVAGDEQLEQEHLDLLDALAPGWDTESNTELYVETRVEAFAITVLWSINRRLANQLIPTRMLDNFVDWEKACMPSPAPNEPTVERRRRLAAKLRGMVNNAVADIAAAAEQALGPHFEALVTPAEADTTAYW